MKKFRNDNDEDDFEDIEVEATSTRQPEKDNRRLIKIILNIILIWIHPNQMILGAFLIPLPPYFFALFSYEGKQF